VAGACVRLTRRSVLSAVLAACLASPAVATVGVVSRERLLRRIAASRALRAAEAELTRRLQSSIDTAQAQFAGEEAELARLRSELTQTEFERRAADFDQRIRTVRREAQERADLLNTSFRQARGQIVAALPAILERLRVEVGVSVIVNADRVLALDPTMDLTDRAIALYDAVGPRPSAPEVDLSAPLMPFAAPLPESGK